MKAKLTKQQLHRLYNKHCTWGYTESEVVEFDAMYVPDPRFAMHCDALPPTEEIEPKDIFFPTEERKLRELLYKYGNLCVASDKGDKAAQVEEGKLLEEIIELCRSHNRRIKQSK